MHEDILKAGEYARQINQLMKEYRKLASESCGVVDPVDFTTVHLNDTSFRESFPDCTAVEDEVVTIHLPGEEKKNEKWAFITVDGVKFFTCSPKEKIYA